ncbi:sugar transferase [Chitinophaga sp.]|uniref:sugar transferase n=1 Tax=Chitinophaga sp. TaxID=1869181 RepID=UPI00261D1DE4|nr:sugar transferase [uncultured Chitinophaga sp.]
MNEAIAQSDPRLVLLLGYRPATAAGSASGKMQQVNNTLDAQVQVLQLLNRDRIVPSAIIVHQSALQADDCVSWSRFFELHTIFRTIPFFLLVDVPGESEQAFVKKHAFIDELVTPACMQQRLVSKINFVKKLKRLQNVPGITVPPVREVKKKSPVDAVLKRSLDIVASSVGLLVASPFMLIIAAMIRMESKGPIFYASPRAGRNYRVFKFYKFRTMVPDADKQLDKLKHMNQYDTNGNGPTFIKVSNDPRITRLGNFLRNSSLDELPQLLNVLRGDMSLVGNRPLPLYEATTLTTDDWAERFLAPAGITGLWQISKRGKKEMSVEERINLDIDYAGKHNFMYDMWLIVNTPFALIQKDNV